MYNGYKTNTNIIKNPGKVKLEDVDVGRLCIWKGNIYLRVYNAIVNMQNPMDTLTLNNNAANAEILVDLAPKGSEITIGN